MGSRRTLFAIGTVAALIASLIAVTPTAAAAVMSPTTGANSGGTLVSISGGSGYNLGTTVSMDCYGLPIGPTSISPDGTALSFVTPDVSPFTGPCAVATINPATIGLPLFFFTAGLPTSAPTITSASSATFTIGVAGTFTVTTTGSPTPAISLTGPLPSGLTFIDNHNGTATISGTPPPPPGAYSLTIMAANGVPPDATQTFTLIIGPLPTATLAPSSGPNTGGTLVTISGGSGYTLATGVSVECGGAVSQASPGTVAPDGTSLTFVTPSVMPYVGTCFVATSNPTTLGTLAFYFTAAPPPPTISRATGPKQGGTLVMISSGPGTFQTATTVRMCDAVAPQTAVDVDGSSLAFITPPCNKAGTYSITTTNPAVSGIPEFTYLK